MYFNKFTDGESCHDFALARQYFPNLKFWNSIQTYQKIIRIPVANFRAKSYFKKIIQKYINASTQLKKIIDVPVIRFNVAGAFGTVWANMKMVICHHDLLMQPRFSYYRQKPYLYKSHLNANSIIMYCIRVPSHATRRGLLLNKVKIA